jgi:hypothetical protein
MSSKKGMIFVIENVVQKDVMQNTFIKMVEDVFKKCVHYDTFGDVTEFSDEDGCVLMTATQTGRNTIQFRFNDDENLSFDYQMIDEGINDEDEGE